MKRQSVRRRGATQRTTAERASPESGPRAGLSDDLLLEFLGLKKPAPRKNERQKEQPRP